MLLEFYKYQGTGNDFIIVDNREETFPKNDAILVARLCDRRFGIGADGLILLENDAAADFKMVYYNADGLEGSMCGNGGRCITAFAHYLKIVSEEASFIASDGLHHASISRDIVKLKMNDVANIKEKSQAVFLNTGSPHHVQLVTDLENYDVFKEGRRLRYGIYGQSGSNINFVEQQGKDVFAVRTYERGVEDETLSCGTGVTAVALAMHRLGKTAHKQITIQTKGGELHIGFENGAEGYSDIYLEGPAKQVFKGSWEC